MQITRILPLTALLPLALAGCGGGGGASNNQTDMTPEEAAAALDKALNTVDDGDIGPATHEGTLVPPAPGEPGGLPDDREPLDEAAARVPTSVEASGATVERWGLALAEGRYGDAYRMWRDNGRASGMSEAAFADSYRKYSEIHVLVGRPQAGGTQTARVPVQVYGRLREGGRPFNLRGTMTLARNPQGQNGEHGQMPWLIAESGLKPEGTVHVVGGDEAAANQLPAAFQGRWASSAADCARQGDDMRLQVKGDSLIFYESEGSVSRVDRLAAGRVRVTARYSGEGETWTRSSTLALSGNGDVLTLDGTRRVRCRT